MTRGGGREEEAQSRLPSVPPGCRDAPEWPRRARGTCVVRPPPRGRALPESAPSCAAAAPQPLQGAEVISGRTHAGREHHSSRSALSSSPPSGRTGTRGTPIRKAETGHQHTWRWRRRPRVSCIQCGPAVSRSASPGSMSKPQHLRLLSRRTESKSGY